MHKTKNLLSYSIMLLCFLGCDITVAAELDKSMQILARNISVLQSSTDKNELLQSLEMMDEAVDNAMKSLPEKISSDDKQGREEYIQELQRLEKEILLAKEKVISGRLSDVRDSVRRMNDIRVEGHNKFR